MKLRKLAVVLHLHYSIQFVNVPVPLWLYWMMLHHHVWYSVSFETVTFIPPNLFLFTVGKQLGLCLIWSSHVSPEGVWAAADSGAGASLLVGTLPCHDNVKLASLWTVTMLYNHHEK